MPTMPTTINKPDTEKLTLIHDMLAQYIVDPDVRFDSDMIETFLKVRTMLWQEYYQQEYPIAKESRPGSL